MFWTAFYHCYCWSTSSWVEDYCQLCSSGPEIWQGKTSISLLFFLGNFVLLWASQCNCLISFAWKLYNCSKLAICCLLEQLELQYLHDYAGLTASFGLNANPVANISGVLGNNMASVGADVSFDSKTGNFTKCNAGIGFSHADLTGSLTL